LAGDLNAKHPFQNTTVSNSSQEKLLQLFDTNEFKITAPQYPTHYSSAGNGDVLDIVAGDDHTIHNQDNKRKAHNTEKPKTRTQQ
jgi:hypothetical protein